MNVEGECPTEPRLGGIHRLHAADKGCCPSFLNSDILTTDHRQLSVKV
jgi:hypothetical protein